MTMNRAPVLLYDGSCGFCCRSVRFVLEREPSSRREALCFAPLAGAFGSALRAAQPALHGVDSVVWYDPASGTVRVRSDAALAVGRHLGGAWQVLAVVGGLVPRPVRDAVYDLIARNRHRLAGVGCPLPASADRARFLA